MNKATLTLSEFSRLGGKARTEAKAAAARANGSAPVKPGSRPRGRPRKTPAPSAS